MKPEFDGSDNHVNSPDVLNIYKEYCKICEHIKCKDCKMVDYNQPTEFLPINQ